MRVLVCGGRKFADRAWLFATLDALHSKRPISVVIHGAYRGADTLARNWATYRRLPHLPFPADWKKGPSAGPIRNRRMLDEGKPDLVVAFPGDKGTANMVTQARANAVEVYDLRHAPPKPAAPAA